MRVYIPGTMSDLSHYADGRWEPTLGFAVTSRLLDIVASDDPDELAEIARDAAALASVVELGSSRRVVVVADLVRPELEDASAAHPAAVRLSDRVPADAIACAFIDEPEAQDDAAAAAAGDEDALDRLEERDLLWFDASELGHLPL